MNLKEEEFESLSKLMYELTGVYLRKSKMPLVESRLKNRILEKGLDSYQAYYQLLQKKSAPEFEFFVNALTTNETFFFRHPIQFDILKNNLLPDYRQSGAKIQVWSGASSSGEEPYSIAIAFSKYCSTHPGYHFEVSATDINSDVLSKAKEGKYRERSLKDVTEEDLKLFFETHVEDKVNRKINWYSVKPEIKKYVKFSEHNLMNKYPGKPPDFAFVRNVMIYFDQKSKQKVVDHIYEALRPGGYLFISLSETLSDVKTAFRHFKSGIYQKV